MAASGELIRMMNYVDDIAATGARFPKTARKFLNFQQRRDGFGRRAIAVMAALGVRMALNLATVI